MDARLELGGPVKRGAFAAAAVAALFAVMPGLAAGQEGGGSAESSTDRGDALSQLATCVAGSKRLAVVLLMDESASLQETDPRNDRVTAAKVAVAGMADLVERSDGNVRVDAQIAGFGVDIESEAPWTSLSPDSLEQVNARIDGFADRNEGLDTDYVNALQGALESIREHSATMGGPDETESCTAVLWFTDGRYSVEDRLTSGRRSLGTDNRGESQTKAYAPDVDLYERGGGERAMEQGRDVLCRDGGVADQYEATEATLLAVPLTTEISEGDRELLDRVVSGPGCGGDNGTGRGVVLPASSLQDLVGVFDQIVTELGAPAETLEEPPFNACPRDEATCPSGTKTFEVDGAMSRIHLLAQVDTDNIAVRLTAPGAPPLELPPSGAPSPDAGSAGATPVRWKWISGNALTVDAESADDGANWAGTWSVTFIDLSGANPGAPVRAKIYLFGDVIPQLVPVSGEDDDVSFRAGETNDFGVMLTRTDGSPVPTESLAGSVTIAASVTDPASGDEVDLGPLERSGDRWVGSYDTPQDLTAGTVNLTADATVTTRSGVALPPTLSTAAVPVLPPVGYPEVVTRSLRIGPITGTEDGVGVIELRGSPRAETCVWLEEVRYDPGSVAQSSLRSEVRGAGSSPSECVRLEQSGTGELTLEVSPTEANRGFVTGSVVLATRPMTSDDQRPVELDLEIQMVKPASAGVAWAIFLGLLLVGVGLPLLAFYVSNWLVAKFAPLKLLQGCDVALEVTERGVTRLDQLPDGRLLHPDDFSNARFGLNDVSGERVRRFTFAGVPFTSAVSSNPFRPPYGRAGDGTTPIFGSGRGNRTGDFGRVALWVTREWVFLPAEVDDPDAPVTGRLVAFVLATDRLTAIDQLDVTLRDRLPSLLDLARQVRTVAARQPVPANGHDQVDWGAAGTPQATGQTGAIHWEGQAPSAPQPPAGAPPAPRPPERPTSTSDDDIWND